MTSKILQLLSALVLLATAPCARAADTSYVRLLPNDGNNVYPATNLLRQWPSNGPTELWRTNIGNGKTAIIEAGGRAFTSTQTGGKQWALCLDPATGATLWKTMIATNENHHQVSGPVTTPVVDGDRVYFIPYKSISNDFYRIICPIFCLRASDGATIWSEGEKFVATEGAMPLIVSNTLYISSCTRDCVLAAVDKMTGKLLWKTADTDDTGFPSVFGNGSSLTYQVVGGIPQIIISVHLSDNMGVNAETGQPLWHWKLPTPVPSSGMISTPVAVGSRVFMSAFQSASSWGICLDMQVKDGKIEPVVLNQSKRLQCNGYHTVSIIDGAVYGFGLGDQQESLQCTDLETGNLLWEQSGPDWSRNNNMTVADGLIFALTKKDELVLAEASKTGYKELGRVNPGIHLGVQQQPTLFNGRLYLRGNDTAVCYQAAAALPPQ